VVKNASEVCIADHKEHVNLNIGRREGLKAKYHKSLGKHHQCVCDRRLEFSEKVDTFCVQVSLNSNTAGVDEARRRISNIPRTDSGERTLMEAFHSFLTEFCSYFRRWNHCGLLTQEVLERQGFFRLENVFCLALYSQGEDYPRSQFVALSAIQTSLL